MGMNPAFAIIGLWVAFFFLILGYIFRKSKKKQHLSASFLQIAAVSFFISLIMLAWWAVGRNMVV